MRRPIIPFQHLYLLPVILSVALCVTLPVPEQQALPNTSRYPEPYLLSLGLCYPRALGRPPFVGGGELSSRQGQGHCPQPPLNLS